MAKYTDGREVIEAEGASVEAALVALGWELVEPEAKPARGKSKKQ